MLTNKLKFEKLLANARKRQSELDAIRQSLQCKYGYSFKDSWLSSTDRKRLESARQKADNSSELFIEFLTIVQSREWRVGVPCYWILDNITWELATTLDAIPAPPPAMGYSVRFMADFASPVSSQCPAAV